MARNFNRKVVPLHGNGVPTDLEKGEIAVSTRPGSETLYTKNDDGVIAEVDLSHYKIMTQETYDSLKVKDENTIYYIKK